MDIQDLYQRAILFASKKHSELNQKIPGTNLPYEIHLSNVAMEILITNYNSNNFNVELAITVALLHDTLEDTDTKYTEIVEHFGNKVAEGVLALTKNENLPKNLKMEDSLNRILELDKEIWCVKIADRITNLQKPPITWDKHKIQSYLEEAKKISIALKGANNYLEKRLNQKINEYKNYL